MAYAGLEEAKIDFSGIGDNTVIPGIAGKRITVYKLWLVQSAGTTVTFKSGSTVLSGGVAMLANGSIVLDYDDACPWFTCGIGESFVINCLVGVQVSGRVYYRTTE